MLAEDHFPSAAVGTTIRAIMIQQFTDLRDGDRFWYEIIQAPDALRSSEISTLQRVILRNTGVRNIGASAFLIDP